ncbi:MAG TPA: NAD-dependent epimerase/dehydratase family protein [Thermoplasmata archaeon]|nr:NAD-dependent epimerase/dehydratase family protein [Thermoplasmata archaeon]
MSTGTAASPAVVTGGAGAIGSVLVGRLAAAGREVRVLDNLSSGRRDHLPQASSPGQVILTETDLRTDAHPDAFRGAGEVWHLAANPDIRLGTENPRLDLDHGTVATFNVLEAARRADVPRILFSSSSVVYGLPTVFPTPEEYGPLLPQSLYGASKLASEGLLSAYAHCYGIRAHIFRFANIIGPTMTHGVIYDFIQKLRADASRLEVLGDGRQSKSYLLVGDCVDAMLLARDRANALTNVFNLGTPDRISVKEIAEIVVRAFGGRAAIQFTGGERGWAGDVPQQLLAIDRISKLGWKPTASSREAVERTVAHLVPAGGR